mmetsp:Transcript_84426/g.168970  ORF Transcript_84426/g.168970 Transcript_84426/m.168970 type:complete len:494 (+) Transcript_84426:252-1733(+)
MPKKPHKGKKKRNASVVRAEKELSFIADGGEGIIFVDCNNVRGVEPKFAETLASFITRLAVWTELAGLAGRVFCFIDHGLSTEAFRLGPLVVIFAGPGRTADDIICEDSLAATTASHQSAQLPMQALKRRKVAVFTNDRNLTKRLLRPPCSVSSRQASSVFGQSTSGRVKVHKSGVLAEMLERAIPLLQGGVLTLQRFPCVLTPLQRAEERLRISTSNRSLDHLVSGREGDSACNGKDGDDGNQRCGKRPRSESYQDLVSGASFSEATWQRVLVSELLRRLLVNRGIAVNNASTQKVVSDDNDNLFSEFFPLVSTPSGGGHGGMFNGHRDIAAYLCVSSVSDRRVPRAASTSEKCGGGEEGTSISFVDSSLSRAEAKSCDATMLARYIRSKRRPLGQQHEASCMKALLWDHRIRHAHNEQKQLCLFVENDHDAAASNGAQQSVYCSDKKCSSSACDSIEGAHAVPGATDPTPEDDGADPLEAWMAHQMASGLS